MQNNASLTSKNTILDPYRYANKLDAIIIKLLIYY
jgi:hypothetical protein